MLPRVRNVGVEGSGADGRIDRGRRRRRPSIEGLEARQLLSGLLPSPTTAAVDVPTPGPAVQSAPIVLRPISLPPIRAFARVPYEGAVASFIANAPLPPERLEATISWGDGQVGPATVVPNPWGGFDIRGEHTYGDASRGPTWIRTDVRDSASGQWIIGAEQRVSISAASPLRSALEAAGVQTGIETYEPSTQPQPARLRLVERRQRYHGAVNRYAGGAASAEDLRYIHQVQDFIARQKRTFFDKFVDTLPFS